jgi:hypothetical protein
MKTIYDAEGNSVTLESVDAREYIETGQWFAEKPAPAPEPAPEPRKHRHTAED